jgi:hypothetical protein
VDLPLLTKSCVSAGARGGTIAAAGVNNVTESAADKATAAIFPVFPILLSM